MRTRRKLLVGVILVLSLTMVSLTGCVFYDTDANVWRSWGPNGDNQTYTGMDCNEYGWFYFRDGVLDWNYTGMACNEYGWWYFRNGQIDWTYTGMACNDFGWWFFNNGQLDWNYTGWAANEYGIWLYQNGRMNFDYNGFYEDFLVENSRAKLEYTGLYGDRYVENGKFNRNFNGVVDGKQVVNGVVTGPVKPEPTPTPTPIPEPTPEPTPEHTHYMILQNYKEATCTTEGYSGDKVCKDCGYTEKGSVIPKNNNHVHVTYKDAVTEDIPHGNTVTGCHEIYCTICGEYLIDSAGDYNAVWEHMRVNHNLPIHPAAYWTDERLEADYDTYEKELDLVSDNVRHEDTAYWVEHRVISAASYHCEDCGKNSTDGKTWY